MQRAKKSNVGRPALGKMKCSSKKQRTDEDAPDPLNQRDYATAVEEYTKKLTRAARNRTLALAFLKGADRKLYGMLWIELENQYTRQHDQYPADLTAAYNMLLNYKPTTRARYDDKKLK